MTIRERFALALDILWRGEAAALDWIHSRRRKTEIEPSEWSLHTRPLHFDREPTRRELMQPRPGERQHASWRDGQNWAPKG